MLKDADKFMDQVRQTADATIDSRFLVSASDLTLKKTTQIVLGDSATGVDVDEFVSKCITFMRQAAPAEDVNGAYRGSNNRARRRQHDRDDTEDDFDMDNGDALDWESLGAQACFPSNMRAPVPSFLLGPLSVQKRARVSQPRRAKLQGDPQQPISKPEELRAEDFQRAESSNLTTICKNIRLRLNSIIEEGMERVNAEATEDMPEDELAELMQKHHVNSEGQVSLFEFAINPSSFGQTVENLFYISFLVREGRVNIGTDKDGLPTLCK
jgi:non-structural maintenance of chromosomes element 4